LEEINVCDNVSEHLIGNTYVKFRREKDAIKACDALNNRWFDGRPIYAELSPVTDFREACCRQYEMGECTRGGFCNFMHLKPISRELKRALYKRKHVWREKPVKNWWSYDLQSDASSNFSSSSSCTSRLGFSSNCSSNSSRSDRSSVSSTRSFSKFSSSPRIPKRYQTSSRNFSTEYEKIPKRSKLTFCETLKGSKLTDCETPKGSKLTLCETPKGSKLTDCETLKGSKLTLCETLKGSKLTDCETPKGSKLTFCESKLKAQKSKEIRIDDDLRWSP